MLDNTLKENILHIMRYQKKDGSFLSFSSPDKNNFTKSVAYRSTFSTSLILSLLNAIDDDMPELKEIRRKAAAFLMTQKSKNWSFNYWARNSKEAKSMPYPDDLDDTFCALSALFVYNPQFLNGSTLASIVNLLTLTEASEGGPYRTWLIPRDSKSATWKDVDLAVNSNIGYFLSLQDTELPHLTQMIESAIATKKILSPYYPSEYPILYFISRFYKGAKTEEIKKLLFSKRQEDNWGDPLTTSLALLTLCNLGVSAEDLHGSIQYLIKQKNKNGYDAYGFCIDPALNGKTYYSGSAALTTTFCTLAIYRYKKLTEQKNFSQSDKENDFLYDQVFKKIKRDFSVLDNDLKKECELQLLRIQEMDKNKHIVLLPHFFAMSLGRSVKDLNRKEINNLCLANLYGWIAYTVYDDFLDEEGDPRSLSVATFCLRRLTALFDTTTDPGKKFHKIFTSLMNDLDNANTWEVSRCRIKYKKEKFIINSYQLPRFTSKKRLAQKSLGHALGPLAILHSLGYDKKSLEFTNTINFFTHYLIARQLNDDAHDWEEDLKKGHITYPISLLLHKAKKMQLTPKSLSELLPVFQEIYWNEVIPQVCEQILKHCKIAKKALKNNFIIRHPHGFEKLITTIEDSALEAKREQKRVIAFLKTYATV